MVGIETKKISTRIGIGTGTEFGGCLCGNDLDFGSHLLSPSPRQLLVWINYYIFFLNRLDSLVWIHFSGRIVRMNWKKKNKNKKKRNIGIEIRKLAGNWFQSGVEMWSEPHFRAVENLELRLNDFDLTRKANDNGIFFFQIQWSRSAVNSNDLSQQMISSRKVQMSIRTYFF